MAAGLASQGPNDAAANKLGGGSRGGVQPMMKGTSALDLGKSGQRSGCMGGSTLNPPAMSPQGTAPGAPMAGGNASKLMAAYKGC
jgi:hypothetical protein